MIEPGIEPRDGDLVHVKMVYRRLSGVALGSLGGTTVRDAVKQLRIIDGRRLLTCADGSIDARAHEILGVVVSVIRQRWWQIRPRIRGLRFPVATPAEEMDAEVQQLRAKIEKLERHSSRSLELGQRDDHERAEMEIDDLRHELESIELREETHNIDAPAVKPAPRVVRFGRRA
jgi:hypothetical protein